MRLNDIKIGKKITIGNSVPVILVLVLAAVSVFGIKSLLVTNEMVDHTHVVIKEAMSIEAAAVDMETGMRGFLLAGEEGFLNPYKQGRDNFYKLITSLKKTVSDNPEQVKLLGDIVSTIDSWQTDVTESTIQLRRDIGDAKTMDDIADLVAKKQGKIYFDKFRIQIATFIARETALMTTRQKDSKKISTALKVTLKSLGENNVWVEHTHEVIQTAMEIEAKAVDMETGMRGYLLAGKPEFLNPYEKGQE